MFLINASFAGAAGRGKKFCLLSQIATCHSAFCTQCSHRAAWRRTPQPRMYVGSAYDVFSQTHSQILPQADRWRLVAQELVSCRSCIGQIISGANTLDEEGSERAQSFLSILSVFGVEIACRLKTWNRVPEIIEVTAQRCTELKLTTRTPTGHKLRPEGGHRDI